MNNGSPKADAAVPPEGAEQAADQATQQQQPPPAETSTMDTVGSVMDGVANVAGIAADPHDLRVTQNETQAGRMTMPTDFCANCVL